MALRIEDYALIGDTYSAALIGRDGTLAWLALPRFDSAAAFASLLGGPLAGEWAIEPSVSGERGTRRYAGETLILETTFQNERGCVRVIDFMPVGQEHRRVVRIVEGVAGTVPMRMRFSPRFDYGEMTPFWWQKDGAMHAVSGPDGLTLYAGTDVERVDGTIVAAFDVAAGQRVPFVMTWHPSNLPPPGPDDAETLLAATTGFWAEFVAGCTYAGDDREAVIRSLLTLKALTYAPTGAIVAAPTTSLPEEIGGVRNWDYRYCWLRDATFTLIALINAGRTSEAEAFIRWLVRTVAGDPTKLQPLYAIDGRRRIDEIEIGLAGYEDSRPVRVGNAASRQFQLDVYGEVVDAVYHAAAAGLDLHPAARGMVLGVVNEVAAHAQSRPDRGMWEVRGPLRFFVHSQVMAWVVFDRAVALIETHGFDGPVETYRSERDRLHAEICERGFDRDLNSFVQSYGSRDLDAALLYLPLVGFLPPDDPRIIGTVAAIERELFARPFVLRYKTATGGDVDGLPAGEGAFLACSFWLVDNYVLQGRRDEARALFDELTALRNDVGLLSEEYDAERRRMVGNFPQAFSHFAMVNSALNLCQPDSGPAAQRSAGSG
jgi:GH15 family glucan-1,4-alpha-glucosidase